MTLRWDLLLPTKTTLIRDRDPEIADAHYDYGVIWVNKPDNKAWLLKDGTITVLPPTTGTLVITGDTSSTSMADLEESIANLEAGAMLKSVYDIDHDDIVDEAEKVDGGNF